MTDTVFNSTPNATDDNGGSATTETTIPQGLEGLVGEGKKYATVEAALASITPAQEHISKLEQELADLRQKAASGKTVEDILTTLQQQRTTEATNSPERNTTGQTLDESAVREVVAKMSAEDRARANVLSADAKLKEKFGDKAEEVLRNKSVELGVSLQTMQQLASESPDAFVGLFTSQPLEGGTPPTTPSANSESFKGTTVKEGTMAFYENMRKTDPKQYWDRKTQERLHREAQEKGEAFFQ